MQCRFLSYFIGIFVWLGVHERYFWFCNNTYSISNKSIRSNCKVWPSFWLYDCWYANDLLFSEIISKNVFTINGQLNWKDILKCHSGRMVGFACPCLHYSFVTWNIHGSCIHDDIINFVCLFIVDKLISIPQTLHHMTFVHMKSF